MKIRAFTLMEILVALIAIAILASLSIISYQKVIETNNDRICQQNLKILQKAVDIYTMENNQLPVSLSQLSNRHIALAYQKIVGEPKENPGLLAFLRNFFWTRPALAQTLSQFYNRNPRVLRCPADPDRSLPDLNTPATFSYLLNPTITDLEDPATDNQALIVDRDIFHKTHGLVYANAIDQYGGLGYLDITPSAPYTITNWWPAIANLGRTVSISSANCCVSTNVWKTYNRQTRVACREQSWYPGSSSCCTTDTDHCCPTANSAPYSGCTQKKCRQAHVSCP